MEFEFVKWVKTQKIMEDKYESSILIIIKAKRIYKMRLFFLILFFQAAHLFGQEIEKNVFGFAHSNTFTYFNVLDTFHSSKINLNPQILRF